MKRREWIRIVWVFGLVLCLCLILGHGSDAAAAERESALHRIQRTGVMRVGWALWFPWTYVDQKTNKLIGMGPEVMEELAKAMGNVKIEWVADSWATLSAGIQADKFDIVYPFTITLPRALVVDYTDDTMRESINFLIMKKDASKFKTLEDVDHAGVKIGATLGSNVEYHVTRLIKKAEIIRLKSQAEGLMSLTLGKVDVLSNAGSGIADAMKNYPNTTVIKGSLALAKNSMCIRQGDQIFLNFLNLFIADMKETGTLDRIFQKYGAKREIFF